MVIGEPTGIHPTDAILFFNFRADRARQLTAALTDPAFPHFPRPRGTFGTFVAMTRYEDDFRHPVLFPPRPIRNTLGEVLARNGRTQLRTAETEKYPHVTYFFNGGVEEPCTGEDRHLVPSPKVATYDLKPEMSALELTDVLLRHLGKGRHDFVLVNYANADMVGHTGSIPSTIAAVHTVDTCVGRLLDRIGELGGTALVTADHGNAEKMLDEDGNPFTAHTTFPVRLILVAPEARPDTATLRDGILADVAPTVLEIMGIPQPPEMTGRSLLGASAGIVWAGHDQQPLFALRRRHDQPPRPLHLVADAVHGPDRRLQRHRALPGALHPRQPEFQPLSELQWYLFSLIFLLGAAYALKDDAHVRVDVVYGRLRRKAKARINVIGSVLMLIPFCVFVLWVSWPSIRNSWIVREGSPDPGGLPRYPLKAVIIVAFALLVLQGISQLLKDVAVLREPDEDENGEASGADLGARGL